MTGQGTAPGRPHRVRLQSNRRSLSQNQNSSPATHPVPIIMRDDLPLDFRESLDPVPKCHAPERREGREKHILYRVPAIWRAACLSYFLYSALLIFTPLLNLNIPTV